MKTTSKAFLLIFLALMLGHASQSAAQTLPVTSGLFMWVKADSGITIRSSIDTVFIPRSSLDSLGNPITRTDTLNYTGSLTADSTKIYGTTALDTTEVLIWKNLAYDSASAALNGRNLNYNAFRDSVDFTQKSVDGRNNRPHLVGNLLNGKPAVRFTGVKATPRSAGDWDFSEYNGMFSSLRIGSEITAFVVVANTRNDSELIANPDGSPFRGGLKDIVVAGMNGNAKFDGFTFPVATGFGIMTANTVFQDGRQDGVRQLYYEQVNPANTGFVDFRKNGSSDDITLLENTFAIVTASAQNIETTVTVTGSLGQDSSVAEPSFMALGTHHNFGYPSWPGANDIAEVILYDRVLSSTEITQVEVYLSGRYNIPLTSAVEGEGDARPLRYELSQNYPNPFNPSTVISYSVAKTGFVNLEVFNVLGQKVATLVNEVKQAGAQKANFTAKGLPSGLYLYRLKSGSFLQTKKMMLVK